MDTIFLMQTLRTTVATLLLLSSLVVFWLRPSVKRRRLERSGFGGPPPRFPLGNLMEMRKNNEVGDASRGSLSVSHDIHSSVLPYFARWRKTYGKVFVYWHGTEPFLYVADPEFLNRVTSGALGKKWGKPNVFRRDRKSMFGDGLIMLEGEKWGHHRNIIAPAFSATNLNAMIAQMTDSTANMLDKWSTHLATANNSEIDVEGDVIKNAADIIARASFGLGQVNGNRIFEKLRDLQSMLFKSARLVGVPLVNKLYHPVSNYNTWRLGREIDGHLLSVIRSRGGGGNLDARRDLLGILLEGSRLDERELVDECKTFFFGGHETTALALTWTLLVLALYPRWQEALREEVKHVTSGCRLDSTMLANLTKMGWVFNEVLRLYPPAPNSQRQAIEDIEVENIFIPKGTNMWVDTVGMHHDADFWGGDVHEFKPERFEGSLHGGCKHRLGFAPFGFGGRVCVGRNLSIMEYKIVLSLILRKFSMSLSPAYKHSPTVMLSLRPSHGLPLIFSPID